MHYERDMAELKQDLSRYALELIETHTAWVFLQANTVLKVKKPVDFGFLNFTTLEARRTACQAELDLNQRLAPDVYLGVVPIHRDARGQHRVAGEGELVDFAVEMRRLPSARRADVLLGEGQLSERHIDDLARTLARFHRSMPTNAAIAKYGCPELLLQHVQQNFLQTKDTIEAYVSAEVAREIEAQQLGFLAAQRELCMRRLLSGRVRDGHGDLRLEHVYFENERAPTIIDCIEFNESFRYADVCADVAFLSMDLERLGRVDLAERFLAVYAREANDYELYALVDFYAGYRAFVRAKVASLLASDLGAAFETREAAKALARRHYLLALSSDKPRVIGPLLVSVGGLIGAGKSTVSELISSQLSAPVISSDRTRKSLFGVEPEADLSGGNFPSAYTEETSRRVYGELFGRAATVLTSGRPVIIDASFRTREAREWARLLATSSGASFFFVECRASLAECERRLRERRGGHVSDARAQLLPSFVERFEPVLELPATEHVVLDTTRPLAESERVLQSRLPSWPSGLTS